MKNKALIILLLSSFFANIVFSQNIEQAFTSMPDEYYLSLPSAQRKEMVKAFKTDTIHTRKNKFRGESSILVLDSLNHFMSIKNSENATVHLKILSNPLTTTSYYALIFTACAPVCDSHIGFYNNNWQFLQQSLLPKITINDFLDTVKIVTEGKQIEKIAEQFDLVFIETNFLENKNNIVATLNSGSYLDKDSYERLKKYLKGDKVLFTWENTIFKKSICYW